MWKKGAGFVGDRQRGEVRVFIFTCKLFTLLFNLKKKPKLQKNNSYHKINFF